MGVRSACFKVNGKSRLSIDPIVYRYWTPRCKTSVVERGLAERSSTAADESARPLSSKRLRLLAQAREGLAGQGAQRTTEAVQNVAFVEPADLASHDGQWRETWAVPQQTLMNAVASYGFAELTARDSELK
jgi:hypothetical protein